MKTLALIALLAGVAHADPVLPRVVAAPTAWLPEEGTLVASGALDHRGDGAFTASYGLGGIAALEIGADSDLRECAPCTPALVGHAAFRIGTHQDAWFAGQPALALAVQTGFGRSRASHAAVVASRVLGPVKLHGGLLLVDGRVGDSRLGLTARPTGGIELTPPAYPKTTLVGDLMWEPKFLPSAPGLEWLAGWGVRYQALAWGSIELDVRHREGEGLAGSTVFVRINGVLAL